METITKKIKYDTYEGQASVELDLVSLTVREAFNAMKKNGFEHLRESWFGETSSNISGGCILGQAALNLGVAAEGEVSGGFFIADPEIPALEELRMHSDDYDRSIEFSEQLSQFTLAAQLNRFSVAPDSRWYHSIYNMCGNAIIHWNDKMDTNTEQYVLPTYQDVVNMAHDVLRPYMNRKIYVLKAEYDIASEKMENFSPKIFGMVIP